MSRLRDWERPWGPWQGRVDALSPELHRLLGRCVTRAERLASPSFERAGEPDLARLEAWRARFADARGPAFEDLRSLRGLTDEAIARSVTPVAPTEGSRAPLWAALLGVLWDGLGETADDGREEPFAAFYGALVEIVVRGVRVPDDLRCDDQVYSRLVGAIVRRWQQVLADLEQDLPQRYVPGSAWRAWLEAAPALARFFADAAAMAVLYASEVLRHLRDDADDLAIRFDVPRQALRCVVDVECECGDPHHGGRSVWILMFEGGTRLVYKPRPSGPGVWFRRFERALRDRLAPPYRLRLHPIRDAGDHCWEAYVPEEPCASVREVEQFYARAGVLLALARFARVHDLHGENVLAHGAYPVPIDLEVVRTATPALVEGGRPWMRGAVEYLLHCPLSLGFLPQLERNVAGELYYDTALPSRHEAAARSGLCLPVLDGRAAVIEDHWQAFLDGYREGARAFAETHASGESAELFGDLAGTPHRFVPRSTALYDQLWKQSWQSSPLTVLDRELALETIAAHTPDEDPGLAEVADEEIWSLTHGDIPFFVTDGGSSTIRSAAGREIALPRDQVHADAGLTLGSVERVAALDLDLIAAAIATLSLPHRHDPS